jgi:hypothetical protein
MRLLVLYTLLASGCHSPVALNQSGLAGLRESFNAADRSPRVMVFFTEGCGACIEAAAGVKRTLEGVTPAPTVFIVWEPVPGSGLREAAPTPTEWSQLKDAPVRQVWDPGHLVSQALVETRKAHPDGPDQASLRTDKREDGVLYDAVVLFDPGTRWAEAPPSPVYVGGGVSAVLAETRRRLQSYAK